jgi:hypothetical protein
MSYKTALTANIPKDVFKFNPHAKEFVPSAQLKPAHTFWDDYPNFKEKVPDDLENKWEHAQYNALQQLKKSPTFQRKFATFAENILCVLNTNTEKGCRIDLRATQYWHDKYNNTPGKKKAMIGFWFLYRQDGFTYKVVYECDDLDDPRTGWFYQWDHIDDCCGFSCDYFGCPYSYGIKR